MGTPAIVVEKRSLELRVADAIRQLLFSGALSLGERLTEENLAKRLSVSRSCVRSALQRLEHESLVVLKPYCGWQVRQPDAQDIWELSTLRSGLEELGARLAAQRIDDDDAKRLRDALERLYAACRVRDQVAITEADYSLHRTIIEAAKHGRLQQSYLLLEQQIRFLISSVNAPLDDLSCIAKSHEALIEAICHGKADRAARLCREHNGCAEMPDARPAGRARDATR